MPAPRLPRPGDPPPIDPNDPPALPPPPVDPGVGRPPPGGHVTFRTIDGTGNNLLHPSWDAAGTDMVRLGPANFAAGTTDGLVNGPNPRSVSDIVVAGNGDADNPEGLSGMMYAWGQFIDHDLDLVGSGSIDISITVPAGDANLPAGSTIALTRATTDPANGLAVNSITGWLDGSMVYGSDAITAASLRTADGHMKTSAGNNLPVVNGMVAAGDVRAAENPDLTALQTLFVREHNRWVDKLAAQHPDWSGDQLYNMAKAITTAEIAHITYNEFLPHLLGKGAIAAYRGYDASVNPTISEEFAGAAYRFGHSIVSDNIAAIDNAGNTTSSASLADSFFEPASIFAQTGADGLLRHLSADLSQADDVYIIDSLRNFLVDPPDGTDLAAINIQRGRDLGLGTLNETRVALGLKPYTSFDQITSDKTVAANLQTAYGSVDAIDLWTGGLAEDHVNGGFVGSTFQAIIAQQFTALRDGDRFWYQNQGFDPATLAQINATTLSSIITRDTDTTAMQADAFVYTQRHASNVAATDPSAPQLVIGINADGAVISGGSAADTLVAGLGKNQVMTGGAGADVFLLNGSGHSVTVTDFTPGVDKIEFTGAGTLSIAPSGGNATMVRYGGNSVLLSGVDPRSLHPGDFIMT